MSKIYKVSKPHYERGKKTMKSTGVIRKIDRLGRIVVPKEIRDELGIAERDPVEIYVDGTRIILTKYEKSCIFCGQIANNEFKGKKVCANCLLELKR